MNPRVSAPLAEARRQDLAAKAQRHHHIRSKADGQAPLWGALTVRVANACDRAAIQRIAELEQSAAPVGPLLIGEILQRPVAAVSLADGSVIADPFAATSELVELMGVRARQLRGSRTPARGAEGWRLLGWRVSR